MAPWRARARRIVFKWKIPAVVGEHGLEMGMVLWSVTVGVNMANGAAPSASLQSLPSGLEMTWGVLMLIAGVTASYGVWFRRPSTIASGLYLFATIMVTFAFAVIGSTTWDRGGATASLLFIVGCVCFIRGLWLKEQEAVLIREINRTRHKDS